MSEISTESIGTPAGCTDRFGRTFTKLRLSITEACNLRCFYCTGGTPADGPDGILGADEIINVCATLCRLGIEEIRITGGEPTLRRDLPSIIKGLSRFPLRKLGLTTNGLLLEPLLPLLRDSACRHINVSLDSLRPVRFTEITGSNTLPVVINAITGAVASGLHVKVNAVLLQGINDDEVFDYIDFSARHNVEVRFLELMRIGPMHGATGIRYIAAQEILDRIRTRIPLRAETNPPDATAVTFTTATGARIGFIASESTPFCGACSRLRLTARGTLRSCLMDDHEVSIRGVPDEEYPDLIRRMLEMKPQNGRERTPRSMRTIGG